MRLLDNNVQIISERFSFVKSVQYLSLMASCSLCDFWPYIEAFFT